VKKIVVLVNRDNKWLVPAEEEFVCSSWDCGTCCLRFRCFTEEPLVLTEKEIRDSSKYSGYISTALQIWMAKGRR